MLNKTVAPADAEITEHIGAACRKILGNLDEALTERYELKRELKFPFGNSYGWGYKYAHKSKHLCYVFFEKDALMLLVQIGKNEVTAFLDRLESFSEILKKAWRDRYPCGDGGWVYYRIVSGGQIGEALELIAGKKSPVK